jgi:hypothetical protein
MENDTMLIEAIVKLVLYFTPTVICCHTHVDGSEGCYDPNGSACQDGYKATVCRAGAEKLGPDEEDWACKQEK